ncbi:MAG: hypothetical protein LBJ11_11735 [Oscillospiraceae bacterium]|nr:hypothetical protein [Oscillospiraceae bacterium]
MDALMNLLSILSNLFGFTSGTFDLFATSWGWLQLVVDTISGLTEGLSGLFGL